MKGGPDWFLIQKAKEGGPALVLEQSEVHYTLFGASGIQKTCLPFLWHIQGNLFVERK